MAKKVDFSLKEAEQDELIISKAMAKQTSTFSKKIKGTSIQKKL